jgi:hypothetical protein
MQRLEVSGAVRHIYVIRWLKVNISPRPALHSFSSTPCVLHVHSIPCSLLIITVIFVITQTCVALHYATLAIHSYALITPFSNKPMFFPWVIPRLRRLVARFPSRRFDLFPRTSSVRFVFKKVALTDIWVSCHVVYPLFGRRKWAHYMLQTHRDTASPQYKGIQINRNYIPVSLGDKFNIRTEQQVKLGLLGGRRVDKWWLHEWW